MKSALREYQLPLLGDCPVSEAVRSMASASADERGAVFTRREVVEFILDLVEYTPDKPLHRMRMLEPSFGSGDFLLPAVARLMEAYRRAGGEAPEQDLAHAVRAVELHEDSYHETSAALAALLTDWRVDSRQAKKLCESWLHRGDFLLADVDGEFDFVIGNPPYVRQELIADVLMQEYRRRFSTIYDRADIYVPFIERSLWLLKPGGVLGFICADRWMKNRYGRPLRELVSRAFHLRTFVDMVDTPAFSSEVIAYPGIFIIARETGVATKVAARPRISNEALGTLSAALTGAIGSPLVRSAVLAKGGEPWITDASSGLELVRALEARLPTLEEAGCKVGIGVATGADKAFIGPLAQLDVEDDRKLPIVMTRDILDGTIRSRGLGVINPFRDGGGLVDLADYPRLARYLDDRREQIAARHVAQKAPSNWYRTIDRIYPELVGQPKLLIPDIKGDAHIVYDAGAYYPHHNLYFITSETWDMEALQAVLLSRVARLFVETYSTKMRGGYLRFQAQYLRRIRVPYWSEISPDLRARLIHAARQRDRQQCDALTFELYGLSTVEQTALIQAEAA